MSRWSQDLRKLAPDFDVVTEPNPSLLISCSVTVVLELGNLSVTVGKLYRFDTSTRYQNIGRLVRGTLKPRLILSHWDDVLRVAGSLKLGWVTASLFITKLQSFQRQNVLTRALQEYGRLNKTIFILPTQPGELPQLSHQRRRALEYRLHEQRRSEH